MGTRTGTAACGLGSCVEEGAGWLLSEPYEGGALSVWGGRGLCEAGGKPGGALSYTCSEPRHLGALWAKATSAPQKQTKLSFGSSGCCCHGDTEGSSGSLGGTGRGLPSEWFEAGGGGGVQLGCKGVW